MDNPHRAHYMGIHAFPAHPHAPAFPADSRESASFTGFTKREWFAMMAMQGLIAAGDLGVATMDYDEHVAANAVRHADALIAALNEKGAP